MWWKLVVIFLVCCAHHSRALGAGWNAADCWQLLPVQRLGAFASDEVVCPKDWQRSFRLGMEAESAGDTQFAEYQFVRACQLGDKFSCAKAKTALEGGDAELRLESYDKACRQEKVAGACAYLAYHFQLLRDRDLGLDYGTLACDLKVAQACFDNGVLFGKAESIEAACRIGSYPAACSEFVSLQSRAGSLSDVKGLLARELLEQGCLQDDFQSCMLLWTLNEKFGRSKDWLVDNCRDPTKIICQVAVLVEASQGKKSALQRIGEACKKKVLRACEHLVALTYPPVQVDETAVATATARLCLSGWSWHCREAAQAFKSFGYLEQAAVFAEKNCEYERSVDYRNQGSEFKKTKDCNEAKALRKAAGLGPPPPPVPPATPEPKTRYRARSDGSGVWRAINMTGAMASRSGPSAVWSGKEVIVWGGGNHSNESYTSGARYNLQTNKWMPISSKGAPSGRSDNVAIWTGKAMLIWGGVSSNIQLNSGGLYLPESDTWKTMSLRGAPTAGPPYRYVWTGRYLMVWDDLIDFRSSYFRYDPTIDKWESLPFNLPRGGQWNDYSVTSTGRELIFWGGQIAERSNDSLEEMLEGVFDDHGGDRQPPTVKIQSIGMSFDPERRVWRELKVNGKPSLRFQHAAVWLGREVLIYGGWTIVKNSRGEFQWRRPSELGELYDPFSGNLRPMPSGGPSGKNFAGLIPAEGGAFFRENYRALLPKELQPGAKESRVEAELGLPTFWFDGNKRVWQSLTLRDAPSLRFYAAEVAAGQSLFVWGGYSQVDGKGRANYDAGQTLGTGAVWTP